ncbi:MAG: metal ABC transporter ATP-binding protein [Pseudoclavibacter sp.]
MTGRDPAPAEGVSASAPGETPAPLVAFDDASFAYDRRTPALEHVTARIRPGEAHALIGPNGAGKSTLLKAVLGLVPTISGGIDVLGMDPHRAAQRIGYMPQTDELDPEFPVTLRQVVMMGRFRSIGPFRFPRRADREAVGAAIERLGLTEHANVHFGSLSGGQQQRGVLARALVSNPSLVLLDEPFNGLDRHNRAVVLDLMRELRESGVGLIVSTHDFEIATAACSHALMLNRCQIAAGPVETTMTHDVLERTFGHATADDEAHGHFNEGHKHYHDTGFRGLSAPPVAGAPELGEQGPDAQGPDAQGPDAQGRDAHGRDAPERGNPETREPARESAR